MRKLPLSSACLSLLLSAVCSFSVAEGMAGSAKHDSAKPWMNTQLTADERAALLIKEMTFDEKLSLLSGHFGSDAPWQNYKRPKDALPFSAGWVPGVARLGIPAQFQTDAGLGVASQATPTPRERTSLPSGLSTAATWNTELAYQGGVMIGAEARASGFNVMLAGGVNLLREPRNGRNFEYGGEDPLLAGVMTGYAIKGVQTNHIISTLKHYAFNDQETGRGIGNTVIDERSARMSDLFALQIANEIGQPGSVMCGYNKFNGFFSCENDFLLNTVLKKEWGFKGYVMSDWGAVHSTIPAANNGLDQESASSFDKSPYFVAPLKEAAQQKWVSPERINDMAHRIVRTLIDKGVFDSPVTDQSNSIDLNANNRISQADAEEGMVLLKNTKNILPLGATSKKILVVGSHADVGVLSGGGSSQVYGVGGPAVKALGPKSFPGPIVYHPSSPLVAIKSRAAHAEVTYADGNDIKKAAQLAKSVDTVILFANQWTAESKDVTSLSLPDNQDALIDAVAKANPRTIVVLETGGPVLMPWLNKISGLLEAWYPGTAGGEAIARILFGEVNPSGHLPATFPVSESQLPRLKVDGDPNAEIVQFDIDYHEGAAVGYKWFDLKGYKPLFPFGYGLSYTQFAYSEFRSEVNEAGGVKVSFKITNTGSLKGKDVAQLYVAPPKGSWEAPKRLAGWAKVDLNAGESKTLSIVVEPRILSLYEVDSKTWSIAAGEYKLILAQDSADKEPLTNSIRLPSVKLTMDGHVLK